MGKASLFERLGLARKPPLTLEAFRERVIEEVLRRQPELQVERVGDADFRVHDGGDGTVSRAYRQYREHPNELDVVAGQMADLILREPTPATPDNLLIVVRPDSFRTGQDGKGDCGPARPIAAGLSAIVAVDTPTNFQFTPVNELRNELGLDDEAIWDRALANLRERLKGATPPRQRHGYLTGVTTDMGLASSLLVLDEYWTHPTLAALGDLVVAPLERDELVLAPLRDPLMVTALRNMVAQRDTSQFLCDRLLLRRNGAWEEYE
jgi:hypothetical protein